MGDYIKWLRGQVGPMLLPIVYATAIVRDASGRILFQRRSDFGAAWWGLPGGLFEPGETPEACLRREVLEETGLWVEPRRLIGVFSSARYRVTYPNGDQVHQVTLCYEWVIAGRPGSGARGGVLRPRSSSRATQQRAGAGAGGLGWRSLARTALTVGLSALTIHRPHHSKSSGESK